MPDDTLPLPTYDRAPCDGLMKLCGDGGLLRPLIELNGEGAAKKHGNVPLDVQFRRDQEVHVYCGHARIIRASFNQTNRDVTVESAYADHDDTLVRSWPIDNSPSHFGEALAAYLERVDVGSKAEGEGILQARWAHLGHANTPCQPWTTIDREAAFNFPSTQARNALHERVDIDVGPARRAIIDIANLRPPRWSEPQRTSGQLDQLAVDTEGNLVLVEIKDAASTGVARLFYAPLQLLKYVYIWHVSLRRLTVWKQLQRLIDARHALGLSPNLPELTGGVRAAVCFGSFHPKPSDEVKRRFYEVLGVVNAHLPAGILPIETWEFEKGRQPKPL